MDFLSERKTVVSIVVLQRNMWALFVAFAYCGAGLQWT